LNMMLAECLTNETASWTSDAKNDLRVWSGFLADMENRMPIPHPDYPPPLCTKNFHSDAA
jgi:hypothetical protein